MEEFSHLGGGGSSSTSNPRATASFMYFPYPNPPTPSTHPQAISFYNPNPNPDSLQPKSEAAGSSLIPYARRLVSADDDAIKAKIVSHPQYSALLEAYIECQKVGAPPEVAVRLSAIAREIEARQQQAAAGCRHDASAGADPELDQFMEAYCNMLVKYREELTRPLQEAMDFLRRVESQLSSLTHGATASIFSNAVVERRLLCFAGTK